MHVWVNVSGCMPCMFARNGLLVRVVAVTGAQIMCLSNSFFLCSYCICNVEFIISVHLIPAKCFFSSADSYKDVSIFNGIALAQ